MVELTRAGCVAVLGCVLVACGDDAAAGPGTTSGTSSSGSTSTSSSSSSTSGDTSTSTSVPADVGVPEPSPWDPDPPPPSCAADEDAALLDEVLANAGLDRASFVLTEADFAESAQWNNGVLGGDFAFSWLWDARADPARIGCVEGRIAGGFDHALAQPHPVASAIRHAANLIDRAPDDALPIVAIDYASEIAALCEQLGGCAEVDGELPDELAIRMAPIVAAAREAIAARLEMDAEPGGDPIFWQADGGNFLHNGSGPQPSPSDPDARTYMLGTGARVRLVRAAAQLAFAIESADFAGVQQRSGIAYTLATPAGTIEVRDDAPHTYDPDTAEILLRIDLGGDDVYRDEVAANRSAANPVSVAIDLGGVDDYGYDEVASPYDRAELLPADDAGRAGASGG